MTSACPAPSSAPTVPVRLPATWADDAAARDLGIGQVVARTPGGRYVTIEMTVAELAEATSDAEYYATDWPYMVEDCRPVGRSAARVLPYLRVAKERLEAAVSDT